VLKQVQTVPGWRAPSSIAWASCRNPGAGRPRARRALRAQRRDVQDVIESALGGKAVTQVWEARASSPSRAPREEERKLTRMENLLIATPNGAYVPLSEVASFRTVGGLMNIARENGKRVFAIVSSSAARHGGW